MTKMNARIKNPKLGDVFQVSQTDGLTRYFQYVGDDMAQLYSNVICVFKEVFSSASSEATFEIAELSVAHYTHCNIRLGIKMGYWTFISNEKVLKNPEPIFRISADYGNPKITHSEDWWVWKLGSNMLRIGKLTEEFRHAQVGIVLSPDCVVYRIEHNKDKFVYPLG